MRATTIALCITYEQITKEDKTLHVAGPQLTMR